MRSLAVAIIATLLSSAGIGVADQVSGRAVVVDGDTIDIGDRRVRLHGIDAPESGQSCLDVLGVEWACGGAAAKALARIIDDQPVRCSGDVHDAHGRLIAVCRSSAGEEINSSMVLAGMAVAFTTYSDDYLSEGIAAQKAGRGLHAGTFQLPEAFRAQRWRAGAAECPPDCPIKGNISERGLIYHVPWSRSYARTRIDAARGERCFCSETEALAAGWRAPYR